MNQFTRTQMILGAEKLEKLQQARVIIFGIGGVGSYVAEALARAGIGTLYLVDHDTIDITNLNRQLIALHSTIGKPKVEVMKKRILDINPEAKVTTIQKFYLPENAEDFFQSDYDYIIDAIDTVSAKLDLIQKAKEKNIPIISSMGTGNKLDPSQFEIVDITKTSVCPLAKVVRKELAKRGIKGVKVLYSKEEPLKVSSALASSKHTVPGSISYVPSCAGLMIAGEVIRNLIIN